MYLIHVHMLFDSYIYVHEYRILEDDDRPQKLYTLNPNVLLMFVYYLDPTHYHRIAKLCIQCNLLHHVTIMLNEVQPLPVCIEMFGSTVINEIS